jgi:hypothetical protein
MNWKSFVRQRSWHDFKVISQHSLGGTEENHKSLSQDSRFPGRDLNSVSPEYEAGVLTSQPRCLVRCLLLCRLTVATPHTNLELNFISMDLS